MICEACKKDKLPVIKIQLISSDEYDGTAITYCPLCFIKYDVSTKLLEGIIAGMATQ